MNKKQVRFIVFYMFILSIISYAQDSNISVRLIEPDQYFEHWTEEVPHSGGIRIGIMRHYDTETIDPNSFSVMLPQSNYNRLCCDINSRDGRYIAHIEYDISSLSAGNYQFKIPSKYHAKLKTYQSKDIVVLASVGNDCNANPGFYVPATWGNGTISTPESVYVLLLSESDITYVEVYNTKTKKSEKFDCIKIPGDASRAYNRLCQIPVSIVNEYSRMEVIQKEITAYEESVDVHNITFKIK